MKNALYLLITISLATHYGCSEPEKPTPQCSLDCNNLLIDNPDKLCVLEDSTAYSGGNLSCTFNPATEACEIDFSTCIAEQAPQSTVVGPKEECDSSALVCPEGYTCTPVKGSTIQWCLQDCSADPTICIDGDYCDTKNFVFDSPGVCWTPAATNEACLAGAEAQQGACSQTGAECLPNGHGLGNACLAVCDGARVDQQGVEAGCAEDEWCLADQSGYIDGLEFEKNDGNYIECQSQNHSVCDEANKYRCFSVKSDDIPKEVCARYAGRCGKRIPLQMDLTEDSLGLGGGLEPENFCNRREANQYCGGYTELEGITAQVECEQVDWGYSLQTDNGEPHECTMNIDCAMRGAECINWSNEKSCGSLASICVAYCESLDGAEQFTCPGELTCAAPASMLDAIFQKNSDNENVQCTTDDDCNGAENYICQEFSDGSACVRSRKVCTDTVVDPCAGVDCGSHGECQTREDGMAACSCADGYTGEACATCNAGYVQSQIDNSICIVDPCLNETCNQRGTCSTSAQDTPICECTNPENYSSITDCQCSPTESIVPIADTSLCFEDPCLLDNPCSGHGECSREFQLTDNGNGFVKICSCTTGWAGENCESCAEGYVLSEDGNCILPEG